MKRRYFLMGAAGVAATRKRSVAASDKVTIALMGIRNRMRRLVPWFEALPDVRIFPCVCDVDRNVGGEVMKMLAKSQGKEPAWEVDIRRILDNKSVDAIVMATPSHWHAPGTILACEAGKDVYVEKPASNHIREGRLMVEAARRNKRVVQVGMQRRSAPVTQHFIEYVQSGKLGRVLMAKVGNVQMKKDLGHLPDEPVPPGIEYDIWTGPVPMLPFNRNHFHSTVNWHWHYGGGDICNDGPHFIDIARWALGVEYPTEVSGMGRKLCLKGDQQTPDTMNISYNYDDKVIHFEMRDWNDYRMDGTQNSVIAYGTEGMAIFGRWQDGLFEFRVFDSKGKMVSSEREPSEDYTFHARNFIDCVKSRKLPNVDIETAHISTTLCHLGNIVARTGRNVRFDAKTETVIGDAEANRLVAREYRQHWSTPKGV